MFYLYITKITNTVSSKIRCKIIISINDSFVMAESYLYMYVNQLSVLTCAQVNSSMIKYIC